MIARKLSSSPFVRHARERKRKDNGILTSFSAYIPEPLIFSGHYVHVVLWKGEEHMHKFVCADDGESNFIALHHPSPSYLNTRTGKLEISPKISTIHFVRDRWGLETVVHECTHLMFHLANLRGAYSHIQEDMKVEENYCYVMGIMSDSIYVELCKINPHKY